MGRCSEEFSCPESRRLAGVPGTFFRCWGDYRDRSSMIPALQVAEDLGLVPVVDVRILDWHLEDEEFGRTVEGGRDGAETQKRGRWTQFASRAHGAGGRVVVGLRALTRPGWGRLKPKARSKGQIGEESGACFVTLASNC